MTQKSKIYGIVLTVCMLLVSTFVFISCGGGDDPDDPVGPSTEYVSITPNASLQADGETISVKVTASGFWTVNNDAEWLTVSPMSGVGSMSISLSAGRNSTGKSRTAKVTVTCGSKSNICTVTQEAATVDETLSVSTSTMQFVVAGEARTFSISSNSSWNVTAPEWCQLSKSSGQGNGDITVTVKENNTGAARSGEIFVKGKDKSATISVSQDGGSAPSISSFYNNDETFYFSYSSEITVSEVGICFITTKGTPDKSNNIVKAEAGSKSGSVQLSIPSPEKNVTYYVRAYVTNAVGTAYSSETLTYKLTSDKPEEGDNPTPN